VSITSAKTVICDRCGQPIDFSSFPAAAYIIGDKNYHIGCVATPPDPRDAEIASLTSQLEEARAKFLTLSEFKARYMKGRPNAVEEARAKAIEECAKVAEELSMPSHFLLAAGEMSAQEKRSVAAVVTLVASRIRALGGQK
jgi:hypothetical protein